MEGTECDFPALSVAIHALCVGAALMGLWAIWMAGGFTDQNEQCPGAALGSHRAVCCAGWKQSSSSS